MNLILLGAPGSGKGTQAKALAQRLKAAHLSTGDIFRDEIAKKTPLGAQVQSYVSSGKLVPDAVVTEIVTTKLAALQGGFILDGFPRTVEQAMSLESFLKKNGRQIDRVVYLNIEEPELLKRLTARRNCASCGELYNMDSKPPQHAQFCDKCGGKLVQRDDDKEETVKRRLMVFRDLTEPLLSYFKMQEQVFEVDAAGSAESLTEAIVSELGQGTAA